MGLKGSGVLEVVSGRERRLVMRRRLVVRYINGRTDSAARSVARLHSLEGLVLTPFLGDVQVLHVLSVRRR